MKKQLALLAMFSFMLVGCASTQTNEEVPQVVNSGPIKDNVTGLVTTKVYESMTPDDRQQLAKLVTLSSIHHNESWKNDDNAYEFTSLNIFINGQGRPCRDYQFKTLLDGREQVMQATACRFEGAKWKITKETTA